MPSAERLGGVVRSEVAGIEGVARGEKERMSAVAWRSQMSYARYSQLCAEVLRECSKEPYHSKVSALGGGYALKWRE